MEQNCPNCGDPISPEELRRLWASYNGSKTSEAKARAARENGKKHRGKAGKEEIKERIDE